MFNVFKSKSRLGGSVFVAFARVVGIGNTFLISMFLARVVTKNEFAAISLLMNTIIIASIAARFGFDRLLMRHIAESLAHDEAARLLSYVRNLAGMAIVSTVVVCLASGFVLYFVDRYYGLDVTTTLLILTMASLATMSFLHLACESLRGYQALAISTICDAQRSGPLLNLCFSFLLMGIGFFCHFNAESVFSAFLASQLVVLLFAIVFLARKLRRTSAIAATFCGSELRPVPSKSRLAKSAAGIAGSEMLAGCLGFGDLWIAGVMLPPEQVATWVVANQLAQVVSLPYTIAILTAIPQIPKFFIRRDLKGLEDMLRSSATMSTIVSLLPVLLLVCIPTTVLSLSYGNAFADAAIPIAILCLGKLAVVSTGQCGACLIFCGHERILLMINILSAITYVIAGILSARTFGIIGLAATITTVTIVTNLLYLFAVRRLIGIWTSVRLLRPKTGHL